MPKIAGYRRSYCLGCKPFHLALAGGSYRQGCLDSTGDQMFRQAHLRNRVAHPKLPAKPLEEFLSVEVLAVNVHAIESASINRPRGVGFDHFPAGRGRVAKHRQILRNRHGCSVIADGYVPKVATCRFICVWRLCHWLFGLSWSGVIIRPRSKPHQAGLGS